MTAYRRRQRAARGLEGFLLGLAERVRRLETAPRLGAASLTAPIATVPASTSADETTSSGSWADLHLARPYKLGPSVVVELLVTCSNAGTAGELRLVDDTAGTLAGPVAVPAGAAAAYIGLGPAELPGDHLSTRTLRLQGRVTAGAGNLGARVTACYSLQS